MTRLISMKLMKLIKMSVTVIVVQRTIFKVMILIPTKTRDWLQLLTTMNVEMLLTGHSREVTSVHKTMDNSRVDLVEVDFDLRLNLNHSTHYCFQRCRLCQQVHDFGKCKAFDELAKLLRTNVDKKNVSPELQKLVFDWVVPTGLPQSADLVIDAECLYAFTGKCEWPEDNNSNNENEKNVEFNGECVVCLDGGKLHEINEGTTTKKVVDDDWLVSICEAGEAAPQDGEVAPWGAYGMSSQRFDRRVRMRALVRDVVNDVRTSILLDTGANVSIITTKLER
ncbi:LOW QUALITY PROTEIN: hypothetical protein PHMEG_00023547 [Phytophthora megakarya]|uniref:Peptidase A2 domain-containing protein n=1 Tax=Phytophthora megakarya TaxID=4795 RepID=A0A225VJ23_9STRA|nr:LOW QUALITY PROTEIN: hypothetical protein PHMEG_00023547 [Phytophthora megakarya]